MPLTPFPIAAQRVELPPPTDPLQSWRVHVDSITIRPGAANAEVDGFTPVAAVFVRPTIAPGGACGPGVGIYINDLISNVSFWMVKIGQEGAPSLVGAPLEFIVRAACGCYPEVVAPRPTTTAVYVSNTPNDNGLIVQVAGVSANQYELLARIPAQGPQVSTAIAVQVLAYRQAELRDEVTPNPLTGSNEPKIKYGSHVTVL